MHLIVANVLNGSECINCTKYGTHSIPNSQVVSDIQKYYVLFYDKRKRIFSNKYV